jgi:phenylacetate-CoA ligase
MPAPSTLRFGDATLDVTDVRLDREPMEQDRFKLAHAWLTDTYKRVPWHRQRMDKVGITPEHVRSFADWRKLPMMGPEDVQATPDMSLLPEGVKQAFVDGRGDFAERERMHRRFTSTGSTGKPKASYYTINDWDVAVATTYRLFTQLKIEWSRLFNCFHAGHLGGKLTEDVPSYAGRFVENRHFLAMTEEQALGQMYMSIAELGGFNALSIPPCLPPEMKITKGITLDNLLKIDQDNYIGSKIKTIFCGGYPSRHPDFRLRERVWEANELAGQPQTKFVDMYACAEVVNVALTCELDDALHVNQGHLLVEITDEKTGAHVKEGERGFITLTGFRGGSRFLRYVVGDEATYVGPGCSCGRATPRIKDIKRVLDKARIKAGCAAGGLT